MPVIAGQALTTSGPSRAHSLHPDLAPHQYPHLGIWDVQIKGDGQDLIQQRLAVLPGAGAFGQLLGQLCPCVGFAPGQGLVEQQHYLVQHIHDRLGQQGQQDRVTAFRLTPGQGLDGQPPAQTGQKPAPLRRQHRHIQRVSVQTTQKL